jgi:hypothetical protein
VWARVQGSALGLGEIRVGDMAEAKAGARASAAQAFDQARALASDFAQHEPPDLESTLRSLREAKAALHRAYWLGGGASLELRDAIDVNAGQFAKLVHAELAADAR